MLFGKRKNSVNHSWYLILGIVPIVVCTGIFTSNVRLSWTPYSFGKVQYGKVLHHRFTLRNRSILPVRIESVIPACECTHTKMTSKRIPPFGKVYMDVTFDTKGFHGKATRFIDIEVTNPRKQNLMVTFDVDVRGAPDKGLEKILFSQSCAKCHVKPGVGKAGKELYDAVCLMCHTTGKAASPIRRGKWYPGYTEMTRNGIPGTSMPGYAEERGGKLTDEQIESIESYFSQR